MESAQGLDPITAGRHPHTQPLKGEVTFGRLHLIDLAGERLTTYRSEDTTSPVEIQYINLSILALGNCATSPSLFISYDRHFYYPYPGEVLTALSTNAAHASKYRSAKTSKGAQSTIQSSRGRLFWDTPPRRRSSFGDLSVASNADGPKTVHVPYLDSKLTHLLKDSLGGNCRTVMLAHVSPCLSDYHQTLTTLLFCAKGRLIQNSPRPNRLLLGSSEFLNVKSESSLVRSGFHYFLLEANPDYSGLFALECLRPAI